MSSLSRIFIKFKYNSKITSGRTPTVLGLGIDPSHMLGFKFVFEEPEHPGNEHPEIVQADQGADKVFLFLFG